MGTRGNEEVDRRTKVATNIEDPNDLIITEGNLKKRWKEIKQAERCIKGTGEVRVVSWERSSVKAQVRDLCYNKRQPIS